MRDVIGFTLLGLTVSAILFLLFRIGVIETPARTRARKDQELEKKSEQLAEMSPEARRYQLEGEQKLQEAGFNLMVLVISLLLSAALIHWFLK